MIRFETGKKGSMTVSFIVEVAIWILIAIAAGAAIIFFLNKL